jgi:hypothetical protein
VAFLLVVSPKMPKIVDIRFIAGRRRQAIEEEANSNDQVMKLAKHRYAAWRKREGISISFEEWVFNSYLNKDEHIRKIFREEQERKNIRDEWKSYGETVPWLNKKEEVSLEQQILDLLNDGWELKGEITSIHTGNKWLQTLVKYESNSEGDLLGLQSMEEEKNATVPTLDESDTDTDSESYSVESNIIE